MNSQSSAGDLPPPPLDLAGQASLFLDLDGTLFEFEEQPEQVRADRPLRELLARLATRLENRIALVSGRSVADVDRIMGERLPIAVAGSHGLERRSAAGDMLGSVDVPTLGKAIGAFEAFAAEHPGVIVERKSVSTALHYRGAPQHGTACVEKAREVGRSTGLSLQVGKMVAELRPPGADKGTAIMAFMAEEPMNGHVALFFGDDVTDEHGFEAIGRIGGAGVLVGPMRETAARYRLQGVGSVRQWLRDACGAAEVMEGSSPTAGETGAETGQAPPA